jgi:hypothetical protein
MCGHEHPSQGQPLRAGFPPLHDELHFVRPPPLLTFPLNNVRLNKNSPDKNECTRTIIDD